MAVVESQGAVLKVDAADASPPSPTTIGNVVSISGLRGGQATVIDITNLASTRREKRMGLADEGQITVEVQYNPDDTGQIELETARGARTIREFTIELNDGSPETTFTFQGYVLTISTDLGVDQVVTASITIEITGAVTKA
jgi:hypothetical protein